MQSKIGAPVRTLMGMLVMAGALGANACGGTSPLVSNLAEVTAASEDGDFAATCAQADEAWAQRGDKSQVETAIALWELATRLPTPDGTDRNAALVDVYTNLAKAYYWLSHGHLRWENGATDAMLASYENGFARAQVAMALRNANWTRALERGENVPAAAAQLEEADVPAMYWYATNLGRWGLLRGITTVLANVPDIKAIMDRVEELDPTYFYGAPDRYFGVYYTKLPFGNPDLAQARARLERNIEEYPTYLESRVLLAEDYGFRTQEREVSEPHLRFVAEADISQWPELLPENTNAQRRARLLLQSLEEYFR